jgi:hypothetical protein
MPEQQKNMVNHFRWLRFGIILPDTGRNPRLTQIPMSAFFFYEENSEISSKSAKAVKNITTG